MVDELLTAAARLHSYLLTRHWSGEAVEGPDAGVRFNSKIGRFAKSYLSFLPWGDDYRYMQAQGYWILANWLLADLTDQEAYRGIARECSSYVLFAQRPEGYWDYPNPEWKGKIATVEGDIAAIGLLESFGRTGDERFLNGARRWRDFVTQRVGFEGGNGKLAVNYFAGSRSRMVPNNSTLTLWTFAKLAEATRDSRYLDYCEEMVAWLREVQLASGELPYSLPSSEGRDRIHFLCYQYNAFEYLDLAEYDRLANDEQVLEILAGLSGFLAHGLTEAGAARFDCNRRTPEVPYYTAAIAAALSKATALGLGDHRWDSERAYRRVMSQIGPDGRLAFHSTGNYGVLTDRRSYPRNLSMILYHLLHEVNIRKSAPAAAATYLGGSEAR